MENAELSPKVARKRRDILTISLKVFAREGFRNTDVQVIADLAKVGKGTVYRHFGNKEQLFLATAKFCLEQLGQFVEKQIGGEEQLPVLIEEVGTTELLRRIARSCAEYYQKNPQAVEIMIQERSEFRESVFPSHLMYRAETRNGLDDVIREAMSNGELREFDVTQVTNAYGDLIYGSVVNGCLEGGKNRLVERVESAVELFLTGLVVPENSRATKGKTK